MVGLDDFLYLVLLVMMPLVQVEEEVELDELFMSQQKLSQVMVL